MLGPGVEPLSCTLAATPIRGGCRGIARTRNSVWAKSPVRYHVDPATAVRVTTTMIADGTTSTTGYLRQTSMSLVIRAGSRELGDDDPSNSIDAILGQRAVGVAHRDGAVCRTGLPPLAWQGRFCELIADVPRRVDQRGPCGCCGRLDPTASRLGDDQHPSATCRSNSVGQRSRVTAAGIAERQHDGSGIELVRGLANRICSAAPRGGIGIDTHGTSVLVDAVRDPSRGRGQESIGHQHDIDARAVSGDGRPLPPDQCCNQGDDTQDLGRRGEQLMNPTTCSTHQVARVAGEYGQQPWETRRRRDGRCAPA